MAGNSTSCADSRMSSGLTLIAPSEPWTPVSQLSNWLGCPRVKQRIQYLFRAFISGWTREKTSVFESPTV